MTQDDLVHPGTIIREQCLKSLHLSVTDAAKGLGVTRKALSELLNGHSGISPEMAFRLSKAFPFVEKSPEAWLLLQMKFDLTKVELKTRNLKIISFARNRD